MEDIIMYVIGGIALVAILIYIIRTVIKVVKMNAEERKAYIVTYLKGAVATAEKMFDSGMGKEKLAFVEEYFQKQAPTIYKLLLMIMGKENLKELIEQALSEIKQSFDTSKK